MRKTFQSFKTKTPILAAALGAAIVIAPAAIGGEGSKGSQFKLASSRISSSQSLNSSAAKMNLSTSALGNSGGGGIKRNLNLGNSNLSNAVTRQSSSNLGGAFKKGNLSGISNSPKFEGLKGNLGSGLVGSGKFDKSLGANKSLDLKRGLPGGFTGQIGKTDGLKGGINKGDIFKKPINGDIFKKPLDPGIGNGNGIGNGVGKGIGLDDLVKKPFDPIKNPGDILNPDNGKGGGNDPANDPVADPGKGKNPGDPNGGGMGGGGVDPIVDPIHHHGHHDCHWDFHLCEPFFHTHCWVPERHCYVVWVYRNGCWVNESVVELEPLAKEMPLEYIAISEPVPYEYDQTLADGTVIKKTGVWWMGADGKPHGQENWAVVALGPEMAAEFGVTNTELAQQ
ncbi:MAG: hypothetical protein GHCLOJNM_02970 [bacterium]|nr:hypothetical protein [bacterium]